MLVEVDAADPSVVTLTFAPTGDEMAIDEHFVGAMLTELERIEADPRCRALVLRGQPGCFCRGLDLAGLLAGRVSVDSIHRYGLLLSALRRARPVVFALLDGEVVGGGVGIACAVDVVLATPSTTFSLPELCWGLLPAMVLPVLLERVPPQKARRLTFGGAPIDAATAHRWGIVDEVVADANALSTTLRGELRRVFKLRPSAVPDMKRHLESIRGVELTEALSLGNKSTVHHLGEPEVRAALTAFFDGETPAWFGRPGTAR